MLRLTAFLYIFIATTLAGILITAVMVVPDLYTANNMIIAAVIGAVLGLPTAWFVAKAVWSGRGTV